MKSRVLVFCLGLIVSSIIAFTDPNVVHGLPGRAYITNGNSNTVSVIDTSSDTVIATIPVGTNPFGVAVNELKKRVYVSDDYDNTISVIDTDSYTVVATIPIDNIPTGLATNSEGTRVYAAYNRINGTSLAVIDTSNNTDFSGL